MWFCHNLQGAFVLCRLFRKSDEKSDIPKYEEGEQGGSPVTTKSSPEDTSSDLVQETAMSDYGTNGNGAVPVESCGNSHMTSDVEEHSVEATTVEVRNWFYLLFFIFLVPIILVFQYEWYIPSTEDYIFVLLTLGISYSGGKFLSTWA